LHSVEVLLTRAASSLLPVQSTCPVALDELLSEAL